MRVLGLACGVLATAYLAGAALATERGRDDVEVTGSEDGEARPLEQARPWAYKRIERAYDELKGERYDEMLETLGEMRRNPRLNPRERALMWQAYAYAYTAQEQYAEAAEAMEEALDAHGLDASATQQMRYNLAQIYVLLERPDDAIVEFDLWFAKAPNPSGAAYYMNAMAHVQKGDKAGGLALARRAVEKGGSDPKEPWLQLVASLLVEQKEYEAALPVLQQLIERYPKKNYWLQLSAVYSGLEQSDNALAVLELAYRQELLTQRSELMTLAQLYLYNQIPGKAAAVLEKGIADGVIDADARTYQLLADSLLHARQREAAMAPLQKAAELSDNGNAYMRLAQVYLEREDWHEARGALAKAIGKGNLTSPGHAYLLLGIADANEKRWQEAEQNFQQAVTFEPVRTNAEYWLKQLATLRDAHGEPGRVAQDTTAPSA